MVRDEHRHFVHRGASHSSAIYAASEEHVLSDAWTDAQACVHFEDDATYVVFRGSESRRDWVMNIVFRLRLASFLEDDDEEVRAHSGFAYQWLSVRESVLDRLASTDRRSDRPVVVCGHSLGGAVSTVAALDLHQRGFDCILVTFGSPRALNRAARDRFEAHGIPAYRVTNGSDVVAMVPIFALHHVGTRIDCAARPWWYVISIRDHSMLAYQAWSERLSRQYPAVDGSETN